MVSLPKEKRSRRNTKIKRKVFDVDEETARVWLDALIHIALCDKNATAKDLQDIAIKALNWHEDY